MVVDHWSRPLYTDKRTFPFCRAAGCASEDRTDSPPRAQLLVNSWEQIPPAYRMSQPDSRLAHTNFSYFHLLDNSLPQYYTTKPLCSHRQDGTANACLS